MVELLIGTVAYRCRDKLAACVCAVFENTSERDLVMCIVDNFSVDGDVRYVKKLFPQIEVIENSDNRGFTRAMNQAFFSQPSRYFLLLNPDTQVGPGAIDRMIEYFESHPAAGAIGCRMLNPDGSLQISARRFPTLPIAVLEIVGINLWLPHNRFNRVYNYEDWDHNTTKMVDWISGSALMVRSSLFDKIGRLDERFFMYSEEVDLCKRIKAAGYEIIFYADVYVYHEHAVSSRQTDVRQVEFYKSLYRYFLKHHGLASALVLRAVIVSWQVSYIGIISLKYLLKGQFKNFRARVSPSLKLLRWGLRPDHPPNEKQEDN